MSNPSGSNQRQTTFLIAFSMVKINDIRCVSSSEYMWCLNWHYAR